MSFETVDYGFDAPYEIEYDTILADCSHWDREDYCEYSGGRLLCGKCFDREYERICNMMGN